MPFITMKLQPFAASLAVVSSLLSAGVMAADGSISFTGEVAASSCRVLGAGSGNFISTNATVNLPNVSVGALNAVGAYGGHTSFKILLSGCKAQTGLSNVYTTFSTTSPAAADSNVMANTESTSPAQGIGLAILDATFSQIDLNGGPRRDIDYPLPATESSLVMELNYAVAYKVLALPVTAGGVQGQVNYTIAYN